MKLTKIVILYNDWFVEASSKNYLITATLKLMETYVLL